jgi:conjugal transfer pilus assembly protein TraB
MTTETTEAKREHKRNFYILATVISMGVFGMIYMLSDHTSNNMTKTPEKIKFVKSLDHIDAESIVLEKTQKELRDEKKETDNLQEKYESLSSSKKNQDEVTQKTNDELSARVATLEKELNDFKATSDSHTLANPMQGSHAFQGTRLGFDGNQSANMSTPGIREDRLLLTPNKKIDEIKPLKNPDTFVPAGSFVSAVMLSGADASAAVNSQANPEPMVFRIIDNGSMPNHTKSHLKGCRVTAAVIGDISSERGKIRLEKLSCTFLNGETVEQDVEGTIEGPDGKNGVRGTPVWRDSAMTQRVFAAGFLSGVADGVSSSYTTNSVSPQGSVQTINSSKIFQNGLATGSSKAMDKLSDYYIQRAEQYHPVIQLSAGTVVDVLFLKGFFLDGKNHESKKQAAENFTSHPVTNSFFPAQPSNLPALPLSEENVRRIEERSKELGLRVTPSSNIS